MPRPLTETRLRRLLLRRPRPSAGKTALGLSPGDYVEAHDHFADAFEEFDKLAPGTRERLRIQMEKQRAKLDVEEREKYAEELRRKKR